MRIKTLASIVLLGSFAFAQTGSPTKKPTTVGSDDNPKSSSAAAQPQAIIHTSMGDIHCTLFPDKAPNAVANFVGLATGKKAWTDPKTGQKKQGVPLYDNTTFHRVIPDFMIQGGDPLGNGTGDPGYKIKDELSAELQFDQPGRLAYANSGPNTNGSQFFITETAVPHLNPCLIDGGCFMGGRRIPKGYGYTTFGQCEDIDIVKQIARVPRNANDMPNTAVTIKHIEIVGQDGKSAGASKAKASKTAAQAPAKKPNK